MITDLISLTEFFRSLAEATEGIALFLPLSNGEKAIDEISAYYTNDYAGTTAFFQVAESIRKANGAGVESLTFYCSLTVAEQPADTSPQAGLFTRDRTMKLLLAILGQIEIKVEESQEEIEEMGQSYEFSISPSERIFPIGLLANVNLEGHYIDIDVTIPANHLLYS